MWTTAVLASVCSNLWAQPDPFQDLDERKEKAPPAVPPGPGGSGFFEDNFTLKKEIFSQFSYYSNEPLGGETFADNTYSRQSLGFEILKKFSTDTSTVASVDVQGRLVWRKHYLETIDDVQDTHRAGWVFEVHNLYADVYNILDPVLGPNGQAENLGRFNFRAGHFYLPFGLNLQTDTHATLIQLSNDRNFGYDQDWYAGFWGSVNESLNYDLYYMLGSGDPVEFRGQTGLVGARLSLSERLRNEVGLEGGLSFMRGERLSPEAIDRSPSVALEAEQGRIVDTLRAGIDARYTLPLPWGSLLFTAEVSAGRDESDDVFTQLYEVDYLADRRQWGLTVQYRRFWQNFGPGAFDLRPVDASLVEELAWYFRNDPSGAFLHSLRLNVEYQLERQSGARATVWTVQYYFYW